MKEMDNLTRDVLAAEAAGFGPWYGRYIAVHGHTTEPTPPKIQKKTAICKACGTEFIQQEKWPRHYCTPECRERAQYRKHEIARKKREAKMADCAASPA